MSLNPRIILLLLIAMAMMILIVGMRLAGQERVVRITRDREDFRRFSRDLREEIQRLENLYESHLVRLARNAPIDDAFAIRRAADQLIGIWQFSVLYRDTTKNFHVPLIIRPHKQVPTPSFDASSKEAIQASLLVPKDEVFELGLTHGWIDVPSQPLMFWLRRSTGEVVILLLDIPSIRQAFNTWLRRWIDGPFSAFSGPDQIRDAEGEILGSVGAIGTTQPDVIIPLRGRFGSWELVSWDKRDLQVSYSTPMIIGSALLSVLVTLLGILLFVQQTHAARLASQRVSFVNRVSHELRTPLTNIMLNLDLTADALSSDAVEARRRLHLMREESGRLGRLIDNVLTFSRHEQGKVSFRFYACFPADIIRSVVEQFATAFQRRGLDVVTRNNVHERCLLNGDAIAQILANLLSNVEKYVSSGIVEIRSTLREGILRIVISDQGPGIPPREAERIFQPFERLHTATTEGSTGTGLGLAIARDLAVGMGGTLQLIPSKKGACFELCVPAPLAFEEKTVL